MIANKWARPINSYSGGPGDQWRGGACRAGSAGGYRRVGCGRGEVEVVKEVIVEEAASGGLKEEEMVEEQEVLEEEDAAPEIEIVPIDP